MAPGDMPADTNSYYDQLKHRPKITISVEAPKVSPTFRAVEETSGQVTVIIAEANKQDGVKKSQNSTAKLAESLAKEVESNNIMRKLEERFGEGLKFESCNLTKEDIEAIGFNVFKLRSEQSGKLLAYIKESGEVLVDMKDFNPYNSSLHQSIENSRGKSFIQENGIYYYKRKGKLFKEGTPEFDFYILTRCI